MKGFGLLLTAVCFLASARSQSSADSVKAVISQLFAGMKQSDTALIRAAFSDSASLQTVAVKQGKVRVESDRVEDFLNAVSRMAAGDADERIEFEMIKLDGSLASVWTPYKFYYKGKFSHCGVNSFQLVRLNGQWKIQYLIDTRRRNPCDRP